LIAVLLSLVLGLWPGPDPDSASAAVFVDARTGDDSSADGSHQKPYRSLTAALASARTAGDSAPDLHVGLGTYGPKSGERFPLDLSGGARIFGMGSGLTILDGEESDGALVHMTTSAQRAVVLSGLTLQHASSGFVVAPDLSGRGVAAKRRLIVQDVRSEALRTGGAVFLGAVGKPHPLELRADGLRVTGCDVGLAFQGVGELVLALSDSAFEDCRLGIFLETDPAENVAEPRMRDEAPGPVVQHGITARNCRFSNCAEAGVLRIGRDGDNRGIPYAFSDCQFLGNRIGIDFRRPCGDSPLRIANCRFLSNTHFGMKIVGDIGRPDRETVIEDCLFRWNGVGLHVTNSQLVLHVRRCHVLDNHGVGIFIANFLSDPTTAWITNTLIAHNGAIGLYCLADSRLLTVHAVHDTIVGNAAAGIKDHRRHGGSSEHEIRHCIIAGNMPDLQGLDPSHVRGSLVGDGSATDRGGNLVGDPRFLAPAFRDYRLHADSPCLDLGTGYEEGDLGERDILGRSRRVGPPDLGAFERQIAGDDS